jgi:thiamine biosynthesis protein ThiS
VTVQLNGEPREVPEGSTLAALIEWLKLPRDRVAVERNLEIVPRARWNVTPIQAGDQLEVVHLVGGGSVVSSPWLTEKKGQGTRERGLGRNGRQ